MFLHSNMLFFHIGPFFSVNMHYECVFCVTIQHKLKEVLLLKTMSTMPQSSVISFRRMVHKNVSCVTQGHFQGLGETRGATEVLYGVAYSLGLGEQGGTKNIQIM